jgi:hypothetical protein
LADVVDLVPDKLDEYSISSQIQVITQLEPKIDIKTHRSIARRISIIGPTQPGHISGKAMNEYIAQHHSDTVSL